MAVPVDASTPTVLVGVVEWCSRAGECDEGGGGRSVDRAASGRRWCILRQRWCQWVWCDRCSRAGEYGKGGGGGSVDRGGVTGCDAVELAGVVKAAAVDVSTEVV